jgi:hypothetical protein
MTTRRATARTKATADPYGMTTGRVTATTKAIAAATAKATADFSTRRQNAPPSVEMTWFWGGGGKREWQ